MAKPDAPYTPPGPALTPCANCGGLIQARRWKSGTKEKPAEWESIVPVSPALGKPHICPEKGATV